MWDMLGKFVNLRYAKFYLLQVQYSSITFTNMAYYGLVIIYDFNGYCMLVFMYAEWSNSHSVIVMIILKLRSTVV